MLQDRYGNPLTTSSPAARDAYVTGVDKLLSADAGVEDAFRQAIAADEDFALAHLSLARTLQVLGRGGEIKAPLDRALGLAVHTAPREQSQIALLQKILTGQGAAAIPLITEHLQSWPRDVMVLAPITGVFGLIGFSGKPGREVDQLAALEPYANAYGDDWFYHTVLAFAQIELHQFDQGERNIETALKGHPRSAHAAHIRAHLFYERGDRSEGLSYLSAWNAAYPRGGALHCHNSWHLALWSLELGHTRDAWAIYQDALRPAATWGPPLNVLTDCASFLARADMAGETVDPALWQDISHYAAKWFPNSGVVFADIHSALAFAMAGNQDAIRAIIDNPKGPAADILTPIARGFQAFARQDWAGTVQEIEPVLKQHERVGGSRAQRDLLEYIATCALLRAGQPEAAMTLISTHRPLAGRPQYPIAGLRH